MLCENDILQNLNNIKGRSLHLNSLELILIELIEVKLTEFIITKLSLYGIIRP